MKREILLLFLLLSILAYASYFLVSQIIILNSPAINLDIKNPEISQNITSYPSGKLQYYPNMKFNHNNLSYSIDSSCSEIKIRRIKQSLEILEEKTKEISFFEVKENPDIEIICENKNMPTKEKGYFIAGEGGPTSIINTSLFYVIEKGIVLLYRDKLLCEYPNVEIHELLHVFGFEHSENKESIMYSVSSCNQIITEDITSELKRLYSIENLPELHFSDVEVSQQGSYLNFNLKIKNSGLKKAENIILEITSLPSENKIEYFDIGNIDYGEGRYLKVENLKIPLRTKRISFFIKGEEEFQYENNLIEFDLN
jgi:hypothetical protein